MSWTVIVAAVLVASLFATLVAFARERRLREKERARELVERKQKELLNIQRHVGDWIFSSLTTVARPPVKVQRLKDNGGAYSIFVGWEEASSYTLGGLDYRGYPIVGINVRMTESIPITVSYGPYPNARKGTEVYYDANEDQIRMLIDVVGKHIGTYSPC